MSEDIRAITMPKWGLAMREGLVSAWHVAEGQHVALGEDALDIETEKITNVYTSPVEGVVRRQVVAAGETVPVGSLLAVVAGAHVPDAQVAAFVAAFEARFADEQAARVANEETGPEPVTVEAGPWRLRYLALGEGDRTPVLLLHGFGGDLNNWLFNQLSLAGPRPAIALDLPGHGGSTKDVVGKDPVGTNSIGLDPTSRDLAAGPGVEMLADAVGAFLDAVDLPRVHLVGHSLGGAVSLALARARPHAVASVSLLCPAGLGPEINMEYIEGFIAAGRRKQMKAAVEQLFADPALVRREMVDDLLKYKRLDGVETALRAIAGAVFPDGRQAPSLRDVLTALTVPAQVIWGAQDRIVPAAHAAGLPSHIPVHVLPGAGHMVHMERAGEVNDLLAALLGA